MFNFFATFCLLPFFLFFLAPHKIRDVCFCCCFFCFFSVRIWLLHWNKSPLENNRSASYELFFFTLSSFCPFRSNIWIISLFIFVTNSPNFRFFYKFSAQDSLAMFYFFAPCFCWNLYSKAFKSEKFIYIFVVVVERLLSIENIIFCV